MYLPSFEFWFWASISSSLSPWKLLFSPLTWAGPWSQYQRLLNEHEIYKIKTRKLCLELPQSQRSTEHASCLMSGKNYSTINTKHREKNSMQRKVSLPLPQKTNFNPTMNRLNAAGWLQILQKKMMVIPLRKRQNIWILFYCWVQDHNGHLPLLGLNCAMCNVGIITPTSSKT